VQTRLSKAVSRKKRRAVVGDEGERTESKLTMSGGQAGGSTTLKGKTEGEYHLGK